LIKGMNPRERFFSAIRREKPDRVPISLWTHAYNNFSGASFREYARDGEKMAKAHLAFLHDFSVDFLKVTPCGLFFAEDWGGKLEYIEEKASVRCLEYPVKSTEDWEKLEVLDPRKARLHLEQLKCLRRIGEAVGKATPFLETIFNPLTTAAKIAGDQKVLSDMKKNPSALRKGLQTITDSLADFAKACLNEGASGIFYSIKSCSGDVISPSDFSTFSKPYDMQLISSMKGADVIMLHAHNDKEGANLLVNNLMDYPVHAINWWDKGATPNLEEAKASFHKKFCLVAGLDHVRTFLKNPIDVQNEIIAAMKSAPADGGFILGPGCVLPPNTPRQNLSAALSAASEHGKY